MLTFLTSLLLFSNSYATTPVPQDPRIQAQAFGGVEIREIGGGVYFYSFTAYTGIFIVSDSGVVVVDGPASAQGAGLCDMTSSITNIPITHVIYSHAHRDHVGAVGCYVSTEDIKYVGTVEAAEFLANNPFFSEQNTPLPDILIDFGDESSESSSSSSAADNVKTLTVGDQTIELSRPLTPHSTGDLWIYLPVQKVLVVVDTVFGPNYVPFQSFALSEDMKQYRDSLDIFLDFDFDYMVTGHLESTVTRTDVEMTRQYFDDMFNSMVTALADIGSEFGQTYGQLGGPTTSNYWTAFDNVIDLNVQQTDQIMRNTYGWGTLPGKCPNGLDDKAHLLNIRAMYFYVASL